MQGQTLERLFAGRNIDLGALHERMQTLMTAEGLDYNRRTHTYNSRLAQELGKWALTRKNGLKLHNALYRTYFVDGRNLADLEELQPAQYQTFLGLASAYEALQKHLLFSL